MINFFCTKHIPLAIIGVVNNLSPVCCSVLAVILLGETLTIKQIAILLLTTLGVIVVVLGKQSNSKEENHTTNMLYIALIVNPFLTASGSIALKKMRPMNEYVVSFWLNVTTGTQSLIMVLIFN